MSKQCAQLDADVNRHLLARWMSVVCGVVEVFLLLGRLGQRREIFALCVRPRRRPSVRR